MTCSAPAADADEDSLPLPDAEPAWTPEIVRNQIAGIENHCTGAAGRPRWRAACLPLKQAGRLAQT